MVLLAALVGGFLLWITPLRAADPTPIACPNGQTIFLEGHAPVGEAVLAYLRGRPVGGGVADSSGHYRLPLRTQERPGVYPVEVRLRANRVIVGSFTCFVDRPVGEVATPTSLLAATTPGLTRTATPIVTRTPSALSSTPTRTTTPSPTGSSTLTTSTPTVSATATHGTSTPTGTPNPAAGSATPTPSSTVTPTGSASPTNTGTAAVSGSVKINDISVYDPVFPDEYVVIQNYTQSAINLGGWRLINTRLGSAAAFIFPTFTLEGNVTISVYSKSHANDPSNGDFYWGQGLNIWQAGDRAELRDGQNTLIDFFIAVAP